MMKLGLNLAYAAGDAKLPLDLVKQCEAVGFESIWVAEVYGGDAISAASWILANTTRVKVGTAIMQMPARSPAMCAMTAMSLNQYSDGRFIAGLGASGPQVVEGWHAVPYGKPITRLREYVEIMRRIFARESYVEFEGDMYQMPYKGEGATGLGKPLKSLLPADPNIKIYTANFTPAGLRAGGEISDGVIPAFVDPEKMHMYWDHLEEGFAKRNDSFDRSDFDLAPFVSVCVDDDLDKARRPVKEFLGLYIGGMGAKGKNFYNDLATRLGYGDEAEKIQDLYLSGKKEEAIQLVPNQLVDDVALVGSLDRIAERADRWKKAVSDGQLGTLILRIQQVEYVDDIARILLD